MYGGRVASHSPQVIGKDHKEDLLVLIHYHGFEVMLIVVPLVRSHSNCFIVLQVFIPNNRNCAQHALQPRKG